MHLVFGSSTLCMLLGNRSYQHSWVWSGLTPLGLTVKASSAFYFTRLQIMSKMSAVKSVTYNMGFKNKWALLCSIVYGAKWSCTTYTYALTLGPDVHIARFTCLLNLTAGHDKYDTRLVFKFLSHISAYRNTSTRVFSVKKGRDVMLPRKWYKSIIQKFKLLAMNAYQAFTRRDTLPRSSFSGRTLLSLELPGMKNASKKHLGPCIVWSVCRSPYHHYSCSDPLGTHILVLWWTWMSLN